MHTPAVIRFRRPLGTAFFLLWFSLATALTSAVPSAPYAWRNVAIRGGGYVTGLAFHPSAPDLLYARTDVGGSYRWDAARRMWLPLNDGIDRRNNDLLGVLSLALDPQDPAKVYLACGAYLGEWSRTAALLRSTDRGLSWEATDLPFKLGGNQDGRGTGERLAVDPHDSKHLLLGTNQDGLWSSHDSGRNWSRAARFPGSGVTFVVFDPRTGDDGRPSRVVFAGAADPKGPVLYRSDDSGKSWRAVPSQPTGVIVHHAAIDKRGTLYLTFGDQLGPNNVTRGAVWKHDIGSEHWTDISPEQPDAAAKNGFGYAGLALDLQRPGTLYVSTLDRWTKGDEIFRSSDDGATWTPLLAHSKWNSAGTAYIKDMKPHWISDLALDPTHPERLWFVTGYGVWATDQANLDVTTGKSINWVFPNKGLEETVIDELVSPPEGAPLLSAIGDLGGFRHDDLTVSPKGGSFQPFHGSNPSLAFAAQKPALLVRTHWGPARGALSRDGGATWENFAAHPAGAEKFGPGMVTISADGARLVWLPKGSKPHYSTDAGHTWQESRTDLVATTEWKTYGPVADPVNSRRFYLYDPLAGALFSSEDGGESFAHQRTVPPEGGILRAEPGVEGHLWLATSEGLLVSTDGGRNFRTVTGVASAHQVGFGAPAPGRTNAALYLDGKVQGEEGFFRSDDRGASWVRINDVRVRLGWLRCITGDARVYGRVYLGTSGRGIMVGDPVAK